MRLVDRWQDFKVNIISCSLEVLCIFWLVPAVSTALLGRDKRAYISALRQANIYSPRQAAAAAIQEPQSTRWIITSRGLRQLVDCGKVSMNKHRNVY